jgi:type IV pilus assembly protein PilF
MSCRGLLCARITWIWILAGCLALASCSTAKQKAASPDRVFAYQQMAAQYMQDGKHNRALKELRVVERIDPENPATLNLIGLSYLGLEQPKAAYTYFTRALKHDPAFHAAAVNASSSLLELGRYAGVIRLLKRIPLEKYNAPERVWNNLGLAYYNLRRYDTAETAFEKAVLASPTFYAPYLYLGRIALNKRDYGNAISQLQKAQRFCSFCVEPPYFLALSYRKLGKPKKSLFYLNRVIELQPRDPLAKRAARLKRSLMKQ